MRGNAEVSLSREEFSLLTDYILKKTGIFYDENKRYYVEKRIFERMRQTGFETFRGYFLYLKGDPTGGELQSLINLLTVNETYFFREFDQLKCFAEEALPEIVRNIPGGKLKVWSAGCSTGEEPYTLAIILLEMLDGSFSFEVHATDINSDVLRRARLGSYDGRSVREVPEPYLKKYFTLIGDRYQISSVVKQKVQFYNLNLLDRERMKAMRDFDAIFCRNVLIYFDDKGRREVAMGFYNTLRPKGFIFLGHSESMSRILPVFKIRKFKNAIIYQK